MSADAGARVLVIVVAYNSGPYLQRCVDALEGQTFTDWEAVIWDNASTDGPIDRLRCGPRASVKHSSENLGFAAGNNRAAALSQSEFIAFLNPDAFPDPDWLERLVAAADSYGAEAIASLQLDDADPDILDGAGDCMSISGFPWRGGYGHPRSQAPTEPCEVFSACGAAALYRRAAFERLGGFEERYFCYCEDVDLGFRLRLAGGRCILEPRAVVRHVGGASSGGKGSDFAEYHGARNRLRTFLRCMPLVLMPVALPAHLLLTAYVLARSPDRLTVRLKGLRAAFAEPAVLRAPSAPLRGSTLGVLRSLSWSPFDLSRRRVVTRPLR